MGERKYDVLVNGQKVGEAVEHYSDKSPNEGAYNLIEQSANRLANQYSRLASGGGGGSIHNYTECPSYKEYCEACKKYMDASSKYDKTKTSISRLKKCRNIIFFVGASPIAFTLWSEIKYGTVSLPEALVLIAASLLLALILFFLQIRISKKSCNIEELHTKYERLKNAYDKLGEKIKLEYKELQKDTPSTQPTRMYDATISDERIHDMVRELRDQFGG